MYHRLPRVFVGLNDLAGLSFTLLCLKKPRLEEEVLIKVSRSLLSVWLRINVPDYVLGLVPMLSDRWDKFGLYKVSGSLGGRIHA
jgi:hypothetical protein